MSTPVPPTPKIQKKTFYKGKCLLFVLFNWFSHKSLSSLYTDYNGTHQTGEEADAEFDFDDDEEIVNIPDLLAFPNSTKKVEKGNI